MAVLDLQAIRYINLLDEASRVKTSKCFGYNNTIIFAVPKFLVSRAIGHDAINVRRIQEKLGKRVRIIREAHGIEDAEGFIREVISPVSFKSVDIKDGTIILNAGIRSKAALIGRNRRREVDGTEEEKLS